MKFLKILFILLLYCFSLFAQDASFVNLTIKDGLPSNRVYFVYKDSKGFMWFCTDLGVSRYNGIKTETFTTEDGLADNDVFNCFEDKWGRIWFATNNGELSFFKDEKFYNPQNCDWLPKINHKGITNFFIQNKNKKSFYAFHRYRENSCLEIDSNQITIKIFEAPVPKKNVRKNLYYAINENQILLETRTKLEKFYAIIKNQSGVQRKEISHYSKLRILPSSINRKVYGVIEDSLFDGETQKILKLGINPKRHILSFAQTQKLQILGYKDGLEIRENKSRNNYLKGNAITGTAFDTYGNMYVSTYSNGVFIKKSEPKITMRSYPHRIKHLLPLNNKVLITTPKNKIYQYKQDKIDNPRFIKNSEKNIESIKKLTGKIGIASTDGSINFLIPSTNDKYNSSPNNYNVGLPNITYCATNYKNEILIGDNSNLFLINTKKIISKPITSSADEDTTNNARILSVTETYNGKIVFATTRGFFTIDEGLKKEIRELSLLELTDVQSSKNRLVGLTIRHKLVLIDNYDNPKNISTQEVNAFKKIKAFKVIAPNIVIYQSWDNKNMILEMNKKNITHHGLVSALQNISLKDIHSDSTYLFINQKNRTVFVPIKIIFQPNSKQELFFKNIAGNETAILTDPTCYSLNYSNNITFQLNYQNLSNILEGDLVYEYAIIYENKDTFWQTTNLPQISFFNPNWGIYDVLMRSVNERGSQSEIVKTTLNIKKPFYATWLFIILVILFAILITYLITKRIQKRKRERELEEKEDEKKFLQAEFKSLNALMNPHFIFNSLNNIQGFINADEKRKANDYLEIFSRLVRQNMQNVQQGLISLDKEVNLVLNYISLEKMRMTDKLSYDITIDQDLDLEEILIPPLTIQPIIENSVKHGIFPLTDRKGFIQIKITEVDDYVSIIVEDNGIGYSQSESKKTSNAIGINNIIERFDKLSKILDKTLSVYIEDRVKDAQVVGTKVEIKIYERLLESK